MNDNTAKVGMAVGCAPVKQEEDLRELAVYTCNHLMEANRMIDQLCRILIGQAPESCEEVDFGSVMSVVYTGRSRAALVSRKLDWLLDHVRG